MIPCPPAIKRACSLTIQISLLRHADDICKCICMRKDFVIWSLLLAVRSTISQHWFGNGLHRSLWWPGPLTYQAQMVQECSPYVVGYSTVPWGDLEGTSSHIVSIINMQGGYLINIVCQLSDTCHRHINHHRRKDWHSHKSWQVLSKSTSFVFVFRRAKLITKALKLLCDLIAG